MREQGWASDELITSPQAEYDSLRHVTPETSCPYLPGRLARSEIYRTDKLDAPLYESLLSRGFRRTGRLVYRPRCRGCSECRQLRVQVKNFVPTRSMRRTWRRNADIEVSVSQPHPTDEKFDLYCRYLDGQHDGLMARTPQSFREFLFDSPMTTYEFDYRLGEKLVGVSIADQCATGLSSVYMFFDPAESKRSLGTYSILWEIEYCRRLGLPYYYLGFYVADSPTMSYKARFRPFDLLVSDQRWVTLRK